jgi:monoamine oxidase
LTGRFQMTRVCAQVDSAQGMHPMVVALGRPNREMLSLADLQRRLNPIGKRLSIGTAGGGIAGFHYAWKLANRGHSVTVFECLDRFGGRIETLDPDGFKVECGPMRFELAIQPLFKMLAQDDLGITFAPFSAPTGESAEFPRYVLLRDERSTAQLEKEASVVKAAALREWEIEFSHLLTHA